ncbi:MAG: dihydroorotase [Eubacterium sp.]|nr:dihydroorotase [Eubacterium sp.]
MLIKNALVISPADQIHEKYDVRCENGQIKELGGLAPLPAEEVLDAEGLVLVPGLCDTHVHFRDPGQTWKEDIHTGASAAAAGGFTSVVCMANTVPVTDSTEVLRDTLERAVWEKIRIYQAAAVSVGFKGIQLTDMEALKDAGAAGFTDDGIPLTDPDFVRRAMKEAARLHLPISLHEEDPALISENGINAGSAAAAALSLTGAPAAAEERLVERDCALALETGACVVIQHVSSGGSVDIIRKYKVLGANLHAEATPHHFSLTEDAVLQFGTNAKMNPPLRTEADRQKILEGLADGTLDLIATDHAPHAAEEKARPFTKAPSGIIGLETSLALAVTNLVKTGILSMDELVMKMAVNPRRLYGLCGGNIAPGEPADITLIDPDLVWTPEIYHSKSSNSPFPGMQLTGRAVFTVCGGRIIYSWI